MSILKKVIDSLFSSSKNYESKETKVKPNVSRELSLDKVRKEAGAHLEKELLKTKTEENRNPLERIVSKEEVNWKAHEEGEDHQRREVEKIVGASYGQHDTFNHHEDEASHQAYLTHNNRGGERHYNSSSNQRDVYNNQH